MPTLAGFNSGRDIEARRSAGLIDDQAYQAQFDTRTEENQRLAEVLRGTGHPDDPIGFLLSTPSELAIINQEDLTKELQQQNLPGTTWQYPNWSRKMRFAVEELRTEKIAQDFTTMFRHWVERTGRGNGARGR